VRRKIKILSGSFLLFILFLWGNNTSRFSSRPPGAALVLAHRGLAQHPDPTPANFGGCATGNILPSRHGYIENTIPSMQAAFDRGADVVEFDVQRTADDKFAVFHDISLECRTDGYGRIRSHSMGELKTLDIGYRYTSDGGKTFPFRGKGVGLIPSMAEVFETFPEQSFLIDVKSDDTADATLLTEHLQRLTPEQRSRLMFFARDNVLRTLHDRLPAGRIFSGQSIRSCLVRYIAYGWAGIVPRSCSNSPLLIPLNVAPWLWGWPRRFMDRMDASGSFVILMGPYPGHEISPGLDSLDDLTKVPVGFNGGVWTNEVDLAVAVLRKDN
jgi:glycerophosphoryl diester phosphodiesterase